MLDRLRTIHDFQDELKTETRKKNILILVLNYLNEEGYLDSGQALARETNIDVSKFEVCDNIDLETIVMEYESYYYVKFAKYPKICKKLTQSGYPTGDRRNKMTRANSMRLSGSSSAHYPSASHSGRMSSQKNQTPSLPRIPQNGRPPSPPQTSNRPKSGNQMNGRQRTVQSSTRRPNETLPHSKSTPTIMNGVANGDSSSLALQGLTVQGNSNHTENKPTESPAERLPRGKPGQIIDIRAMLNDATKLHVEEGSSEFTNVGNDRNEKIMKPLGGYVGYNAEWRDLAQNISRDIFSQNPNVKWADIIGLDEPKRTVKEAVVYPIRYPQLFKGILSPWKGLLLYGPPGTGKTLLAKAIATECGTTFFNISASSIVSKWRGDSEKLVRVLFEMARFYAPSTIFLDELEAIMSQRGSQGGGEHEGSRRMKTELLVQMDGLAKTDDLVFLLAASNLPWELDHAMLRRLEKRILVDLPTYEARKAMFKHHLPRIVNPSEGGGLELMSDLDYDLLALKTEGYSGSDIQLVSKEAAMRPVRKIFDALENHSEGKELHIRLDTIVTSDVLKAIERTKPSGRAMKDKYVAWQKEYESV
ncbi:katanin p60 ATPase-containing subunit A-like 2 isoform X5 [Mya arenaria]|uniref:katanin p60 ATPase-containing subunit A-like 2 isoform X5 n=1 Tax=Mya arenaria TaxID=6604 RepID=UPI0022E12159|nr:katanin p60 ATPase-containing subunit A-like 2 isoform X5 [Mya arenaria]